MDSLEGALKGAAGGFLNPDIQNGIEKIGQKINIFLNDPFWQDVGIMTFMPENSQVLQRREGYRQLFSLYSLLQLCTQCDFDVEDFKNLLETKDSPTLYEYWSFFAVKDILDRMKKAVNCGAILAEDQKEQKVYQGVCVRYEDDIILWFNKYCPGSTGHKPQAYLSGFIGINESYSHALIPDIVISKADKLLIFDAKYKGKRGRGGGFYGEDEQGGISSWKDEDIDKMHAYREAIQNVVGAFILYPGDKPVMYPVHDAKRLVEGVGALPLKPATGAVPVLEHMNDLEWMIRDFLQETD